MNIKSRDGVHVSAIHNFPAIFITINYLHVVVTVEIFQLRNKSCAKKARRCMQGSYYFSGKITFPVNNFEFKLHLAMTNIPKSKRQKKNGLPSPHNHRK